MKKIFFLILTNSIGASINCISLFSSKKATQIAHRYFSEPRKGKLTSKVFPEAFDQAVQETIVKNDDNIQIYIWKGNENIMFLIHGWESNSLRWRKMLPILKKSGSTIIAIDGPAQGLSSGKEFTIIKYAEFIDAVAQKFNPNNIIGHSMGGQTSLYYQFKYQNPSLKKIVALGAPSDFEIIFNNFTSLLNLSDRVIKALDNKYTTFLQQDLKHFSSKEFVKHIDTKGLLIHDIDDKVVLIDEGIKISESWKGVEFIQTKGLGHKLHDEELYHKISDFLFK
jgi:pimeloyl-ACP methyl ester carboxylesterase